MEALPKEVVVGLDETIERRRGAKIAAKGIYRDPVRSSKSHFVKASGLRWISMQLLAEIPWAGRVWGLPFLTVLAPSERYHQERGQRHTTLSDWGRQMIRQVRRWLPDCELVVATGTAVWYHAGQPTVPLRWVLLRDPLGQFEPQALLSTDPPVSPTQIIAWFVARWPLEVTCHEVRAHLGVETQRQWSALAILGPPRPCSASSRS